MEENHILQVAFPAQGHINPSIQFAKRLVKFGAKVTFLTSRSAIRRMNKPEIQGIDFVSFSDGFDNGWSSKDGDARILMDNIKSRGSEAVVELITSRQEQGKPFKRVIYATLIPWVGQVAQRLQTPSTLLWIQPATLFCIYYYYFHDYVDVIGNNDVIELPGLPVLSSRDLPSFLLSSNPNVYDFALPTFREHFEVLDKETNPIVLVNSFDALEPEPLNAVNKYNLMAIGPFIPSAFLDGKDPSDTSFGADLIKKSVDYIDWLDSKDKLSVVYVAFGSYSQIAKEQLEEIAKGLLRSQKPFLWVIRAGENGERLEDSLSCKEELVKQGMIVPWCSQVEVLSHSSVGCFVTHCGWNSSMESLVFGVPVVAFPQWTDQATNAKLIQDYWKTGVRLATKDGGLVEGDELERCLEIAMGDKEMRRQATKWRDLAKDAMKEDGTSNINLKTYMDNVLRGGDNI